MPTSEKDKNEPQPSEDCPRDIRKPEERKESEEQTKKTEKDSQSERKI